MNETHISFYLKANRIHIYVDALRSIGSPNRICFMIEKSVRTLLIVPYEKRDFKSHSVPNGVYKNVCSMEISSVKLCRLIAGVHNWNVLHSYRVPGKINTKHNAVIFELTQAKII